MKRLTLVMIVFFSILALLIIALLAGGILLRNTGAVGIIGGADGPTAIFQTNTGERRLLVNETIPMSGIEEVALSLGSDTVDIYQSEDEQFHVIQYGVNLTEDRMVKAYKSGSTLSVERREGRAAWTFGIGYSQSWVELHIPEGYHRDLRLSLSSGSLKTHCDLSLAGLEMRLSSGSLHADHSIRSEDARVRVSSGNLSIGELEAESFTIGVSSGGLEIGSLSGSGSVQVSSGSASLSDVSIAQSLHARVSSGSLRIGLSGDPSLQFRGRRDSGTLRTYFEQYYQGENRRNSFATVGDGLYKELTAQVASGSLYIDGSGGRDSKPGSGASADGGWEDGLEFEWDKE